MLTDLAAATTELPAAMRVPGLSPLCNVVMAHLQSARSSTLAAPAAPLLIPLYVGEREIFPRPDHVFTRHAPELSGCFAAPWEASERLPDGVPARWEPGETLS